MLLVVVMVNLGFWQLRRLHERRADNALVTAHTTQPSVPISSVAGPDTKGAELDALRYRAVSATGTYDQAGTIVVASRTGADGGPGGWVVTPLHVGDDTVLVNRGFSRLQPDGTTPAPPAPSGIVTVDGYALAISGFDNIAHHDFDDARGATANGLPVVLQAKASTPADDASLAPVPLPPLDEGPHLSYAIQWFAFFRSCRRRPSVWKGRAYAPDLST